MELGNTAYSTRKPCSFGKMMKSKSDLTTGIAMRCNGIYVVSFNDLIESSGRPMVFVGY